MIARGPLSLGLERGFVSVCTARRRAAEHSVKHGPRCTLDWRAAREPSGERRGERWRARVKQCTRVAVSVRSLWSGRDSCVPFV